MKSKLKTPIFSLLLLSMVAGALAQPSPPHEIYGKVTDGGEAVEALDVEAVTGSDTFSAVTDSDGYYSIKIPSGQSSFDVVVDGVTEEEDVDVQSGSIDNYSFSGDYLGEKLSVSIDDEEVDEGENVELDPSITNEGEDPSYDWRISGDSYGSFIDDDDEEVATFEASNDVSEDREVEVELEVTKASGSSKTAEATISINDVTSPQNGGGPGAGGAPGEEQPEEENQQDQQQEKQLEDEGRQQETEIPEPVEVDAEVDNETGSASAQANATANQTVTMRIPETVDENVTEEVIGNQTVNTGNESIDAGEESVASEESSDGDEDSTSIESVSATAASDTSVSITVSKVDENEVEERKDNQISYSNIEVDGEVSNQVITFSVKKSTLENRNASPSQVVKERYTDGEWEELETRQIEELEERHRFEAETDGNSVFAVAIKEENVTVQPSNSSNNQTETPEEHDREDGSAAWLVGLLVLLASAALFYFRHELKEKFSNLSGRRNSKNEKSGDKNDDSESLSSEDVEFTSDGEEDSQEDVEDEQHVCSECGDSFDTERGLHIHQGEVHGEKHFCDVCGDAFDSERGLHIHQGEVHKDEE